MSTETLELTSITSIYGQMPAEALRGVCVVEPKPAGRVVVQAYLKHVKRYGHDPSLDLVYRWPGGALAVGDLVLCPKTPMGPGPFVAMVVSLNGDDHPYKGPVKTIIRKVEAQA